jgi:hypothetical protein
MAAPRPKVHDVGMDTQTHHMPGTTVLIAISVTLVAAVVTIAFLGRRDVEEYAAGSPEAAAQAYVQHLFDGEWDDAYAMLTPEAQERCAILDVAIDETDTRVATFEHVRTQNDRVVIDVRLTGTRFEPGPLPVDTTEIDTRLTLEQVAGEWRIAGGTQPVYGCAWR